MDALDARYMARALRLAERGRYTTDPNPRVGCVIVRDGKIAGEGWHERTGEPHAEIHALKTAGDKARGATVYLTLEPCTHHGRTPPCSEALIKAGIGRLVVATQDPNPRVNGQGLKALADRGIAVEAGLMETSAQALNPGFISRMVGGRPFVRVKLAASLDGRTARSSGESKWITGEMARADVQRWRARSAAILTGSGTVLADDPSLNVRAFDIGRHPLRVVVDSELRTPPTAKMLKLPGKTLIVHAGADGARAEGLEAAGAEVLALPGMDGKVDLKVLLHELGRREVNELLVEAGATLCGALLADGLVDELVCYFAPHLMGSAERAMFTLPPLATMADRTPITVTDVRTVGADWRITAKVAGSK
jgi:diaminohydroxyphosphoribosylaminopyrimidine deaminase / 5-amino-6-(5-phosphoribosylamino)uracil reductase